MTDPLSSDEPIPYQPGGHFLTEEQRRALLDQLARESQAMGLYDGISLVITDNTKPS